MNTIKGVSEIIESLLHTIKEMINSAPFSKHFQGKVTKSISDSLYMVSYKNREVKVSSYHSLNIGETVWVCVPNGNWDSLFVVSHKGDGENI